MLVELVYVLPKQYCHFHLELKNHSTVKEVIEKSGILKLHKDIDLRINKIGIYGTLVNLEDIVSKGDRIEIYRLLSLSPMELRRQKAKRLKIKN
ncbi:RnfH family protein [Candidatus Pantoea edessiphila]|uniref:UPF0125 protein CRV10_00130 n=1 Tax=Candidatus Pantoea edessiphila TaxID=2044610 RepID=A0A2P5SX57_9GAMM|nr:RnfH family protein [Candidatus Pantoea edessiphila]